jgi:hypothetical protein
MARLEELFAAYDVRVELEHRLLLITVLYTQASVDSAYEEFLPELQALSLDRAEEINKASMLRELYTFRVLIPPDLTIAFSRKTRATSKESAPAKRSKG